MVIAALSGYDIQSLNIPSLNEYIGHYAQLMSLKSIDNWNFYMAFVLFRVAAIAQGVYKRFTLGQPIICLSIHLSVSLSVSWSVCCGVYDVECLAGSDFSFMWFSLCKC